MRKTLNANSHIRSQGREKWWFFSQARPLEDNILVLLLDAFTEKDEQTFVLDRKLDGSVRRKMCVNADWPQHTHSCSDVWLLKRIYSMNEHNQMLKHEMRVWCTTNLLRTFVFRKVKLNGKWLLSYKTSAAF